MSTGTTTSYAGNYVYENGALQFFNQPEGYVEPVSTGSTNFAYVYQFKDHLGNVRLSYSDNNGDGVITPTGLGAEIREENNYYPFGLQHKGYNNVQNGRDHKYKFIGREWQDELGLSMYDLRARQYDPAIARFVTVDPLTDEDEQLDKSNYAYAWNDPIKYNDPDGECPSCFFGALVGAAVDYGEQVATNYVEGKENPFTNNINLVSIGTSAVAGFVTSGGSAIESLGAKASVKFGAAVINNTVSIKTSSNGLKTNVEKNIGNVLKNTAIDLAADKLAGKVGEKAGSALSKTAITNAGRLSSTAKTVVNTLGQNVTRSTTATVKTGVKIASNVVTKTVESATKTATNKQREKVKDKTNN